MHQACFWLQHGHIFLYSMSECLTLPCSATLVAHSSSCMGCWPAVTSARVSHAWQTFPVVLMGYMRVAIEL